MPESITNSQIQAVYSRILLTKSLAKNPEFLLEIIVPDFCSEFLLGVAKKFSQLSVGDFLSSRIVKVSRLLIPTKGNGAGKKKIALFLCSSIDEVATIAKSYLRLETEFGFYKFFFVAPFSSDIKEPIAIPLPGIRAKKTFINSKGNIRDFPWEETNDLQQVICIEYLRLKKEESLMPQLEENREHVTCIIPTKDRYSCLSMVLISLVNQLRVPNRIVIIDSSESPLDLPSIADFSGIFSLASSKGCEILVGHPLKKGGSKFDSIIQALDLVEDLCWFLSDDHIVAPDALAFLLEHFQEDSSLGAVSPSILLPRDGLIYEFISRNILKTFSIFPSVQFGERFIPNPYLLTGNEYLVSSYVCRKPDIGYVKEFSCYDSRFSPDFLTWFHVLFTNSLFLSGLSLHVDTRARVTNFAYPMGGMRGISNDQLQEQMVTLLSIIDERFGVKILPPRICLATGGVGDNILFKSALGDILAANPDRTIIISPTFPEVFSDLLTNENDLTCGQYLGRDIFFVSSKELSRMYPSGDNPYAFCWSVNWPHDRPFSDSFRAMYCSQPQQVPSNFSNTSMIPSTATTSNESLCKKEEDRTERINNGDFANAGKGWRLHHSSN